MLWCLRSLDRKGLSKKILNFDLLLYARGVIPNHSLNEVVHVFRCCLSVNFASLAPNRLRDSTILNRLVMFE